MGASTVWQEEVTVMPSETDFQKRLRLSSFFIRMQDAAAKHASSLGFGYEDLLKRDLTWVLSRIKVRFFAFPEVGQKYTVKTWPKGIQQKLFFMRDYLLFDGSGGHFAAATSAYVLVNVQARRIAMPQALDTPVPDNNGLSAIDESLDKIAAVPEMSECYTLQAGYSQVDLLGHVNNARYIDWVSDCFSLEEYRAHQPGWLQINFLNEVKPGEAVSLLRGARPGDSGGWYVTGMNRSSGAKAFEAEFHWENA